MPYLSNYSAATWHLALHPLAQSAAGTHPDSAAANNIWRAQYAKIKGKLGACGITVTSGTTAWDAAGEMEAMFTSGTLAIDWSARGTGEVQKFGLYLLGRASAQLSAYCKNPTIMSAMSATYCAAGFDVGASGYWQDKPETIDDNEHRDITFTRETEY